MESLTLSEAAVIVGTDPEAIRTDLKRNVISARKAGDRVLFEWEDLPVLSVLYVAESDLRGEARRKLFADFHRIIEVSTQEEPSKDLHVHSAADHAESSWSRAKQNVVYAFAAKNVSERLTHNLERVQTYILDANLFLRLSADLVVDFKGAIDRIEPTADLYARGLERIESDPDRLGGEPVFKGTRLAVRQIGAMKDAGDTTELIRAEYPYLTEDDVAFAKLYWLANPTRGRPPKKAPGEAHR